MVGGQDLVPIELGQPVGEVRQQPRRRVLLAVPLRVEGRVLQTEVGGQVDDVPDLADQLGDDRLAGAVGQAQEDEIQPSEGLGLVGREDQVGVGGGQARVQLGGPDASLGVTGGQAHVEVRVLGAQPQQLRAGEP